MRGGSRADVVVANLVRAGRQQPQRFRHGSFRLPPRSLRERDYIAPRKQARLAAHSAVRRRGLAAAYPLIVDQFARSLVFLNSRSNVMRYPSTHFGVIALAGGVAVRLSRSPQLSSRISPRVAQSVLPPELPLQLAHPLLSADIPLHPLSLSRAALASRLARLTAFDIAARRA